MSDEADRIARVQKMADLLRYEAFKIRTLSARPRIKDGSTKNVPAYEAKAAEHDQGADDLEWLISQVPR